MKKIANFGLIGAAGYIAPRHMKAIRDCGGDLLAAIDPHDNVGVLDQYFPYAQFFRNFENFESYFEKIIKQGTSMDYVSICSPNALHEAHIRFALRNNAHAICEKPLALGRAELDELEKAEKEFDRRVFTILQLRVHPLIMELKNQILSNPTAQKHDVTLCYITSRGPWYQQSWKGKQELSGGLVTNIGVHFFDMLSWIFGKKVSNELFCYDEKCASGLLTLEKANIKWFLSIDREHLPQFIKEKKQSTYRSIRLNNNEIEFSDGFTDLHTSLYKQIIEGKGFSIDDARSAIEIVEDLRHAPITSGAPSTEEILSKMVLQ